MVVYTNFPAHVHSLYVEYIGEVLFGLRRNILTQAWDNPEMGENVNKHDINIIPLQGTSFNNDVGKSVIKSSSKSGDLKIPENWIMKFILDCEIED